MTFVRLLARSSLHSYATSRMVEVWKMHMKVVKSGSMQAKVLSKNRTYRIYLNCLLARML